MKQFDISNSQIDIFNRCQFAYYLMYKKRVKQDNKNLFHFVIGSAFHLAIELILKNKLKKVDILNVVIEKIKKEFKDEEEYNNTIGDTLLNEIKEKTVRFFDNYYENFVELRTKFNIKTEVRQKCSVFSFTNYEIKSKIMGIADAIINDDLIIDWKTSFFGKDEDKLNIEQYRRQLFLYTYIFGIKKAQIKILDLENVKIHTLKYNFDKKDLQFFKDIKLLEDARENNVFKRTGINKIDFGKRICDECWVNNHCESYNLMNVKTPNLLEEIRNKRNKK